jgi:hypothetical protein
VTTFTPLAKTVDGSCAVACANSVLEFTLPATVTAEWNGAPFTKNCTVPVGSCEALAVAVLLVATVAVSVTVPPDAIVVWLELTDVVVEAFETTTTADTGPLGLKLGSPEYLALIVCVPAGSWMF